MGPQKLTEKLVTCMKNRYPVLIKGAPGVGKSDIVEQVCERLKYNMLLTHPVVSDPTDYKGQPCIVDGKAEFLPFGDLRQMIQAKKWTIVFIDDLGQAPAVVQAACMQLILARRVNGHKISDKVIFVAATNRRQDRAAVTGILEPVKSRFHTIYELEADKDDWIVWAFEHNMPEEIIGFVNFRPELLCTQEATNDIVNHPCPRTIFHAGELINCGLTDLEDLSGAIGTGAGTELYGFLKIANQLPSIDGIILDPDKSEVPTDPSALYAVTAALATRATKDNVSRIFRYGDRMSGAFSALLVRDAIRKDKNIQSTKAFIEWCSKHGDALL
jgi:hypothetical protein